MPNIEKILEKPDDLPLYVDDLYMGSGSVNQLLGDTIQFVNSSNYEFDLFIISNEDQRSYNATFFQNVGYYFSSFINSFSNEKYTLKEDSESIQIWVSRQTTHVDLMQKMIDKDFTVKTGIRVDLSVMPNVDKLVLIKTDTLLACSSVNLSNNSYVVGVMNGLRQLEVKVEEAESGIDVALTKRFDVLTKIVNTVKGYAKHEAETFENVTKWRAGLPKNLSLAEKQEFMGKMDAVQAGINVAVEAYPELKAEKLFSNLTASITDVEEHLQAARRLYNSNVSTINSMIVTFPRSIVAGMIKMERKEFFEADTAKREDVEIGF